MLLTRAFIYGLCRMWIDGHFTEWHVDKPAGQTMAEAVEPLIDMIGGRHALDGPGRRNGGRRRARTCSRAAIA